MSGPDHDRKVADFRRKIKATRGSRFNQSSRLERRDKLTNAAIAWLSATAIVTGVVPKYITKSTAFDSYCGLFLLSLGLIILVLSLLHLARRDSVTAYKQHECGLALGEILDTLNNSPSSHVDLANLTIRYASTMSQYENHSRLDFWRFIVEHSYDYHPDVYHNSSIDDLKEYKSSFGRYIDIIVFYAKIIFMRIAIMAYNTLGLLGFFVITVAAGYLIVFVD